MNPASVSMEETKIYKHENMIIKIRTIIVEYKNRIILEERGQALKALIAFISESTHFNENININTLQTNHYIIDVNKKEWQVRKKIRFFSGKEELTPYKYMYILKFHLKKQYTDDVDNIQWPSPKRLRTKDMQEHKETDSSGSDIDLELRKHAKRKLISELEAKGYDKQKLGESKQYPKIVLVDINASQAKQRKYSLDGEHTDVEYGYTSQTCVPYHQDNMLQVPNTSNDKVAPVSGIHRSMSTNEKHETKTCAKLLRHRDRHTIEQEQLDEELKLQQLARTPESCGENEVEDVKEERERKPGDSIFSAMYNMFKTPLRKVGLLGTQKD